MAVADVNDYLAKLASAFQVLQVSKNSTTITAQLMASLWTMPGGIATGAAPTTAAVPTKATAGALDTGVRVSNPSADAFLAAAELITTTTSPALLILCDRLSHQGGLDATVTTTDLATNLPTAALTRYTSGSYVKAAIEIYTTLGTTEQTLTCKYTNQAGTGGQVSQPTALGGTGGGTKGLARSFLPLNLAAGDTGIRSIESYTLAASTGLAGAFGFTLFRPLAAIPIFPHMLTSWNALFGGAGALTEIVDDACLFFIAMTPAATLGSTMGTVRLIEA